MPPMKILCFLAGLLLLAACSSAETSQYPADEELSHAAYDDATPAEFDEAAARELAEAEVASEGYDGSYGCTDDCSGHDAGWQWRADNGYPVEDQDDYGSSNSFAEGAMAYEDAVDERLNEKREEFESSEE
jgi:hypothetical protein